MQRLCVFSGSSPGAHPDYVRAAEELGRALAKQGVGLVYGGASVGLMGADRRQRARRRRRGRRCDSPGARRPRDRPSRVDGAAGRRLDARAQGADGRASAGFVALPGGMGTPEELFEVYTWTQLGLHAKPLGLLDVRGYYAQLVGFLDHTVTERFVTAENRELLVVEERAEALLEAFRRWRPPSRPKWIDRTQT